ncbi:MAG: hypothetical protein ACP6IP_01250 [Candidatus Njordarchaeia archaeon]
MPSRRRSLEVWFAKPLKFTIMKLLEERGDRISLSDLLKELKEIYENISLNQINRALLSLEIEGFVHVEVVGPKERIIEKISWEGAYLPVTED